MGKEKGEGTTSPTLVILNPNAGALTNFEVLDFLRSRGATSDPSRITAQVTPSELKVYDYLVKTPACDQTREKIRELAERCKEFDLAKAEVLCLINLRTAAAVEAHAIIEQAEERSIDLDEVVDLVTEVLPPRPSESRLTENSKEVQQAEAEQQFDNEMVAD